ncbi:sulfotransferase [Shewanella olleyana]|uniref:sulfotransferase family protein n=1 Tax=Shewanella olleyana TaxID=135626 RepID=UPI00200E343E|nr:sulfotransferase [Shewanella olleyana]MCL1067041.1 sulfotransferase [Shewanella olleyana]
MKAQLIFVIGAARSGTHLVGSTLSKISNNTQYLAEINEFWNKYNLDSSIDTFRCVNEFPDSILEKARADFLDLIDLDADFVIEKTAANSLRTDFLVKLFPDAKFVYVYRDGRDVVNSVIKKNLGDSRKVTVTSSKKEPIKNKIVFLYRRILDKLQSPTFSFSYFAKNYKYYTSLVLGLFGYRTKFYWGPRFTKSRINNLHEYAELQWVASCCRSTKDLKNSNSFNILFDDIINDRSTVEKSLASFIGAKQNSVVFHLKFSSSDKLSNRNSYKAHTKSFISTMDKMNNEFPR